MEGMVSVEVLPRQHPTQPLFKAPNAQAARPWFHTRRFPYRLLDPVDFGVFAEHLRGAHFGDRASESVFKLNPI